MYYEFYQLFHHIIDSVQMINVFMSTLSWCDRITRVNMQGFENLKCFNMLNSTYDQQLKFTETDSPCISSKNRAYFLTEYLQKHRHGLS